MQAYKTIKTEIIILRKTPYQESSLIVASLSPEFGRLDFIARGAKRISKKSSPEIDIFRKFNVEFKENDIRKNLITPLSLEFAGENDNIAAYPDLIIEAYKTIKFLLKNEHTGIPCHLVYQAFNKMLDTYSKGGEYPPFLLKLTYLYENGLLPHKLSRSEKEETINKKILNCLLKASIGEVDLPELPEDYIRDLSKWVQSLCLVNELDVLQEL